MIMRLAILAVLVAAPAWAEVPRVVTDFGPVTSLVADVMGDLGEPQALLPKGGDPHDFQLRPSQADMLQTADAVFWVGPELMPALGDALASLAPQAQVVPLLHLSGKQRAFADGAVDPHAWLDPANAAAWLQTIADRLSALDPDNAGTYRDNARAAQAQLTADDAAWAARLAPVKGRAFVAYHDALGYFTDHYGLQIVGSIELGDASTPSAAQLVGIRDIITTGQAVCVFPETGRDPKFIASLTEGLQVKVGAAQDIEYIGIPPGRGQYRVLLDTLVTSVVDCLKP